MKRELELLREKMRETGVDACLIPTSDFHGSEYVGDYFKCREYISGFTGSAGTLVVTLDEAGLWTDGRYFLQAAKQLEGSGIMLRKERQPGVRTPGCRSFRSIIPEPSNCFAACRKYLPSVHSPASSSVTTRVPAEPVKPEIYSLHLK